MKYVIVAIIMIVGLAFLCQASYVHPDVPINTTSECVDCPPVATPLEIGIKLGAIGAFAAIEAIAIIAGLVFFGWLLFRLVDWICG